ncbi:hypothetical protein VM1G_11191 [Cytospora mali]|uniref:Uncharacterized protein n=1 Tax=Cytospora mali TaxID=578113 RepID=A0A194VJT1_CYTMA|nr:hypothetical protein VM1G_11191 [Valsa mali]
MAALLRVCPLLGATSSMTFVVCEDFFIRPLAPAPQSDLRRHANRLLPAHGRWLWPGLGVVGASWGLSIATAIANLRPPVAQGGGAADKWYRAGLCFSALHFAFGYRAMWLLWTIRKDGNDDEDEKKDNVAYMKAWLRVNFWRGLLADLPSWLCYLVAFILATD